MKKSIRLPGEVFSKDEIKAVLENIADTTLVDSFIIMLYTGVRVSELLNIKCSDVDIAAHTIHVAGTKTDAADRIVPVHRELIPYLEKLLATNKEYLIEADGEKVLIEKYRIYFRRGMQQIGIDHSAHILRHTFIKNMESNGVETAIVQKIVGHTKGSQDTTELLAAIDQFKIV